MKIRYFNLIEIVLTVAVIAFGVVVILGMLPKGLKAARNAGIESFSSDIIDQICNYLTYNDVERNELKYYEYSLAKNLDVELAKYDNLEYIKLLEGDVTMSVDSSDVTFKEVKAKGGYGLSQSSVKGLYAIARGSKFDSIDEAVIDFSGLLYIWKSSGSYACLKASHAGSEASRMHDCGYEGCTFTRDSVTSSDIVQINMELSYPLSLPYEDRTKRYYSFEVKR